ncbi:MAG: DUF3237 domain-containing protein [Porticoccaceae bacterium]
MKGIAFKPLFTVEFETSPQIVGDVPAGYFRRAGIISAGSFKGEMLNGKALPGGGDWLIRRPDGVIHLDVRAILETDEGETLYMTYTGRLKSSPEAEARLARGETLFGDEIYFRTWVQFETAAPRLLWLNDIVAVGVGHRRPQGPYYDIYELL